ncbi:hypothetical protein PTTG_25581 [Puccinia triticina 1-1 BBBD Race 1]|uniref:D-lactate dehydrogenase (cytochrome) n=2 Tax=Puccinia triticina TaxID=208348 RepID=A0A180H0E0_PUCT1|nr:uncharacterized protein PtA15_11A585 [Puccinia triticina]OAV98535.1 hypothetical protein PTTG_25581 [Puccinia triticina 1-1 BBBD Race 1]WAQ89893.1 hypothetical protein PtA15_11A585 [Puccinia triticina]WAR59939.1 hypothetical protein PtB15_11B580 [Puccinia triticina]
MRLGPALLTGSKGWRAFQSGPIGRRAPRTNTGVANSSGPGLRLLSNHPVPSKPSIASGPGSSHGRRRMAEQKWSTSMVFLTSTLIGSIMYVVGINVQLKHVDGLDTNEQKFPAQPHPSPEEFTAALQKIQKILPADCVSWDRADLLYHGTSPWTYHHPDCLPGAVLYPRSTEDVSKIVKVAYKYGIPIVPFSGGTSLEGHFNAPSSKPSNQNTNPADESQLQPGHSFTLDFSRNMNKIIELHESDLDVVVQPGISYENLNDQLKRSPSPHKLFFPVDPGPGAQIGGMIGTGCSGTNAVKYGTMRENVINMTVVLANGEIIKTRQRAKKCAAGPDLGKLFIGSEGTLGLVTEVTLKLQPVLPVSVGVTHFKNVDAATSTVLELIKEGVSLACIELLDDQMMKAINHSSSGLNWDEKPSLFLKFTGTLAQIKSDEELTAKILKRNGGSKMRIAKTDAEAEEIWHARKVCLWSTLDYIPGHRAWTTDVCVPISHLPRLISETKTDIEARKLKATMLGHVGDGNFHCIILFKDEDELAKVRECVHQMVELAQRLDGTCTGEHGVGIGKIAHLENELGKGTIEVLKKLKKTLDPKNIMNPGKLIPSV